MVAGAVASAACVAVSVCAALLFIAGVMMYGSPASEPPAAEVLPLPAGITITSTSGSCCSGSQTFCDRQILVSAAARQAGPPAVRQIRSEIAAKGWLLAASGTDWQGCRDEGWLLDRHEVCLTITATTAGAAITLETADSW